MADDDFFDDEAANFGEPVHPDDRLWRHPSEINKVPSPGSRSIPDTVDFAPVPTRRQAWGAIAVSGLVGAAVAVTVIMMTGLGDREISSDEASVTTRPLGFTTTPSTTTTTATTTIPTTTAPPTQVVPPPDLSHAAAVAAPSMVWITVVDSEGTTDCAGVVVRNDGHLVTDAQPFIDAAPASEAPADPLADPTAPAPPEPPPAVITVRFHDGTSAAGSLVGIDPITELAVLRVDRTDLTPAVMGEPRRLQPGAPVLLLSPDRTGQPAARTAMVNAVGTPARVGDGTTLYDMIQFDAPVPSTLSGAPLLDIDGNVVGVTVRAGNGDPFGLATPIDSASTIAADLINEGHARHAWLGIEVGQEGAEPTVKAVIEDTPAEIGGLQADDVIMAVDGAPVPSMAAFVTQIRARRPGDQITITYRRGGVEADCVVVLGERGYDQAQRTSP